MKVEEFNVIGKCNICKLDNMCTEVITITKDKQQKVEFWCKDCVNKINEEEARQQVYEDIIRSMH